MATKFYLHNAASVVAGTLPASGASVATETPDQIGDSGTNRSMDATIGVSQTSKAITTPASTASHQALIARFVSPLISAQTISAQNVTVAAAYSESSTNSDFFAGWQLVLWRPGTGAVVSRLYSALQSSSAESTASETAFTRTIMSTSATALDGDVLILELWRYPNTQAMGTAYTNTVFYDGTTEASATTNAAFVQFTNDVALFAGAAATSLVIPRPRDRGLTLRPRKARSA